MGRVDKDKNVEVFIKAIPDILKKVNAHFVIAGMGDEVPRMQKLADQLGVARMITWVGWLDKTTDDFVKFYQSASVFAIPSQIETQSIVTMEAMAAGLPIVGANSGALPELIKNNENGYLFKPGDSEDMARKIVKILIDEETAKRMSESSIKRIAAHEIDLSFQKFKEIYEKVFRNF